MKAVYVVVFLAFVAFVASSSSSYSYSYSSFSYSSNENCNIETRHHHTCNGNQGFCVFVNGSNDFCGITNGMQICSFNSDNVTVTNATYTQSTYSFIVNYTQSAHNNCTNDKTKNSDCCAPACSSPHDCYCPAPCTSTEFVTTVSKQTAEDVPQCFDDCTSCSGGGYTLNFCASTCNNQTGNSKYACGNETACCQLTGGSSGSGSGSTSSSVAPVCTVDTVNGTTCNGGFLDFCVATNASALNSTSPCASDLSGGINVCSGTNATIVYTSDQFSASQLNATIKASQTFHNSCVSGNVTDPKCCPSPCTDAASCHFCPAACTGVVANTSVSFTAHTNLCYSLCTICPSDNQYGGGFLDAHCKSNCGTSGFPYVCSDVTTCCDPSSNSSGNNPTGGTNTDSGFVDSGSCLSNWNHLL